MFSYLEAVKLRSADWRKRAEEEADASFAVPAYGDAFAAAADASYAVPIDVADDEPQLTMHIFFMVGPDGEHFQFQPGMALPSEETFVGSIARSMQHFPDMMQAIPLPQRDPTFFRLLMRFWDRPRVTPLCSRRYRVDFTTFSAAFGDHDDDAATFSRLDSIGAISSARVQLMFRGAYVVVDDGAVEATLEQGAMILHEVRVRAVESGGEGGRVLPSFTVHGQSTDGTSWRCVARSPPYRGDNMEVRTFCLANTPQRRVGELSLRARFLALPPEVLWPECDFHCDSDLRFWLARGVLETKSKLKGFLAVPSTVGDAAAGADVAAAGAADAAALLPAGARLKQWPGKDALQALAAWWLAATLCEGHAYTEPQLYGVIRSLCAMQPDHAVMRKEMVRRQFLQPPEIVLNADSTTTTLYRVNRAGLEAVLQGDWTSGTFAV